MILVAAFTVLATTNFSHAQTAIDINKTPYIEVTGVAETRIAPNKIEILVNLNQAESKGKIPMIDMEKAFATALKQAGIDTDKQVVITAQSSSSAKRQSIYQFKNYKVTVESAAEASYLFQCLRNNNVASVSMGTTTRTDIREIQNETKVTAIKNARTTATTLTEAIGQRAGNAIQINEYANVNYGGAYALDIAARKSTSTGEAEESPLVEVKVEDITISQRVTVRFELL